ncbi:hypothetical protein [Agreia sp. Leaf244]|uniref:hypothetical protein n=1 Tax=Agreia sp. Leaf244 TaxID=1736305 RepID=UPI000A72E5DA|nr:hypothetical protein [Agreia sp. Leaf244]
MSEIGLGLAYWLPQTQFSVEVTSRYIVSHHPDPFPDEPSPSDESDQGSAPPTATSPTSDREGKSWRVKVTDVDVTSQAVEDPDGRRSLRVDAGLLETISLTIGLDDRGFIRSINSETVRDVSPVISLVAKVVGAIMPFAGVAFDLGDRPSLESEWDEKFPQLRVLRDQLIAHVEGLLRVVSSPDTSASVIIETGAAIEVLQSQLASVSQVRRAWIANQAHIIEKQTFILSPSELLRFPGPSLPQVLDRNSLPAGDSQAVLMDRFRTFIAIVDTARNSEPPRGERDLKDSVALRRSRRSIVGTYIKQPDNSWKLQEQSVRQLDIVDSHSETDYLELDGSWFRSRKFELVYHPDMSLKSYGVGSASSLSTIATATGEVLDAVGAARKEANARSSADEEKLAKAKTQLELLQTSDQFEILSATHAMSAELAALEQLEKLKAARS